MLENTKREIERKLESQDFSAYAIIVGYGDKEWQFTSDGVDLDSYFDAASIGKVFPTTALALRAIGEGKLSLDDTLDKFFPNVPDDKKEITIKNLMTHTSGMIRRPYPEKLGLRGREGVCRVYPLKSPRIRNWNTFCILLRRHYASRNDS